MSDIGPKTVLPESYRQRLGWVVTKGGANVEGAP